MNNKDHLVGRLTSVLVHPINTPLLPTRTGNGLGRQTRLHWILGPTNTNLRHSFSRKLLIALCGVLPVYIKAWHCVWYGIMQCIVLDHVVPCPGLDYTELPQHQSRTTPIGDSPLPTSFVAIGSFADGHHLCYCGGVGGDHW